MLDEIILEILLQGRIIFQPIIFTFLFRQDASKFSLVNIRERRNTFMGADDSYLVCIIGSSQEMVIYVPSVPLSER